MVLNAYYSGALAGSIEVGRSNKNLGLLTQEDMAGRACEDRYANADLVCAICDNGGEIVRYVCLFQFLSAVHYAFPARKCKIFGMLHD